MKYCIDTGTLILSWHFWYSHETHPTFWLGLEDLARTGKLKIPEQVLDEISEKDDELSEWCKNRKDVLIYEATDETEERYRTLVNTYPHLAGRLGMGESYADLYVVAVAIVNDATVVTTEDRAFDVQSSTRQRKTENFKLTNVCHEQSVPFIRPYTLVQREGWVFQHLGMGRDE